MDKMIFKVFSNTNRPLTFLLPLFQNTPSGHSGMVSHTFWPFLGSLARLLQLASKENKNQTPAYLTNCW